VFEAWQAYLKGDRSKPPCFPAGTLVKTPEGDKAIEDLAPGDLYLPMTLMQIVL
jgi:hypothetical protein